MTREDYLEAQITRLLARIGPWGTVDAIRDVIASRGWDVLTIGTYPDFRVCFVVRDRWGAYTLDEVRDAVEEWRPCGTRVTVDD